MDKQFEPNPAQEAFDKENLERINQLNRQTGINPEVAGAINDHITANETGEQFDLDKQHAVALGENARLDGAKNFSDQRAAEAKTSAEKVDQIREEIKELKDRSKEWEFALRDVTHVPKEYNYLFEDKGPNYFEIKKKMPLIKAQLDSAIHELSSAEENAWLAEKTQRTIADSVKYAPHKPIDEIHDRANIENAELDVRLNQLKQVREAIQQFMTNPSSMSEEAAERLMATSFYLMRDIKEKKEE